MLTQTRTELSSPVKEYAAGVRYPLGPLVGLLVLAIAAVGVIGSQGFQLERQERLLQGLSTNLDRLLASSEEASQSTAKATAALRSRLEGQEVLLRDFSTNLDRLLVKSGDVSQSTAAEVERRLSALERQLGDPASWPGDEAGSNAFKSEVIACLDLVPATAEDVWIPRLSPVRWGAEVIQVLKSRIPRHTDEDAAEVLADARTIRSSKPRKGSESLYQALAAAIETLEREMADGVKRRRIALAEEALGGSDLRRVAQACTALGDATEEPLLTLRHKLEAHRQKLQWEEKLAEFRRAVGRAAETPDESLRVANLIRLRDATTGVLLDLQLEDPRPDWAIVATREILAQIQQHIRLMAERAREVENRRHAAYQAWALEYIRRFNSLYADALKAPNDSSPEGSFKRVMNGMIWYLLPIDTRLLDLSVEQFYQKAYAAGWKKLDGREDQLYVAMQSAEVKRKTLDEVR